MRLLKVKYNNMKIEIQILKYKLKKFLINKKN